MKPIVNPLFFYLASIADSLCSVIFVFGVIALIVLIVAATACLIEYTDYCGDIEDSFTFLIGMKVFKWSIIISIIIWTIFIFLPSKEVLIEMEVAKYATPCNIKTLVTEIVSAVKEITK